MKRLPFFILSIINFVIFILLINFVAKQLPSACDAGSGNALGSIFCDYAIPALEFLFIAVVVWFVCMTIEFVAICFRIYDITNKRLLPTILIPIGMYVVMILLFLLTDLLNYMPAPEIIKDILCYLLVPSPISIVIWPLFFIPSNKFGIKDTPSTLEIESKESKEPKI